MENLILDLQRKYLKPNYSIGLLSVNGKFFCNTIEPTDRGLTSDMDLEEIKTKKVHGQTAIPLGQYKVVMTYSPRFKTYLPLLLGVKCWEGVRIHPGNTVKDTEGCVLCGMNDKVGWISNSRYCVREIIRLINSAALKGQDVYINIHY